MADAWRGLGAFIAAVTSFVAVFALGFWITKGSAWMIAFIPLAVAVPSALAMVILAPIFRDDD
jgi:hypothetical protein